MEARLPKRENYIPLAFLVPMVVLSWLDLNFALNLKHCTPQWDNRSSAPHNSEMALEIWERV